MTQQHNLQQAEALLLRNQFQQAKAIYVSQAESVFADPKVLFNFALCLDSLRQTTSAIAVLERHITPHASFNKCVDMLARCLEKIGKLNTAVALIEKHERSLNQVSDALVRTKAYTLRMQGQLQQAQACSASLAMQDVDNLRTLAGLAYDNQELGKCLELLELALSLSPHDASLHDFLNNVLWAMGRHDDFLRSYEKVSKVQGADEHLQIGKVHLLLLSERYQECLINIEGLLKQAPTNPLYLHLHSVVLTRLGQDDKAQLALDLALQGQATNTRFLTDKATFYLRNSRFHEAQALLQRGIQLAPYNQELLAYLGTSLKQTAPHQAAWLNNYSLFVQECNLKQRYSDKLKDTHAWQNLQNKCSHLHTTIATPLDQSVRKGTQTNGKILARKEIEFVALKELIVEQLSSYLNTLKHDPNHPFLGRIGSDFYLSGSWSVRLRGAGHHVNHIHPHGWLSACLYVEVPEATTEAVEQKEGWLRFGQSSLALNEEADLEVAPEEAKLVIFPAYFWHGTVPTSASAGHRMTIICDIEPLYH